MTARQLLAALKPYSPAFDPATGRYRLRGGPPPVLVARFRVLKTGVAALLVPGTGWLGLLPTGHAVELSPDLPIPPGVACLSLLPHGGHGWDRIPLAARFDLPDLFAASEASGPARKKVPA